MGHKHIPKCSEHLERCQFAYGITSQHETSQAMIRRKPANNASLLCRLPTEWCIWWIHLTASCPRRNDKQVILAQTQKGTRCILYCQNILSKMVTTTALWAPNIYLLEPNFLALLNFDAAVNLSILKLLEESAKIVSVKLVKVMDY